MIIYLFVSASQTSMFIFFSLEWVNLIVLQKENNKSNAPKVKAFTMSEVV